MSARFVVSSVTGFAISPGAGRPNGRKPATIWYVLDSAYCFRTVDSFIGHGGHSGWIPSLRKAVPGKSPYERAMERAMELNARDAWQDEQ